MWMNVVSREKDEKSLVKLTVSVGEEAFSKALDLAYRKGVKRMNVPGFRKGKAPRKMIETLYGSGVFFEDAVNIAYPDALDEALSQEDLEPVGKPEVEVTEVSAEGFTFVASFYVSPEVQIGNYTGLPAHRAAVTVADDEVEEELSYLQQRNARMLNTDDAVENGHTVTLDYKGFLDGVPFEGGEAEGASLVIGSGRFIPGFEEQLIGKKVGDEGTFRVTFPEEYHEPSLSGKEVEFAYKLHEVKMRELPVLDDEFAKDVSEFDTLEAFKENIRTRILETKKSRAETQVEEELLDQIFAATTVDVPPPMVDEQFALFIQNLEYRLATQGLNFETYLSVTQQTPEDLEKEMRARALRQVTLDLAFEKIAEAENLTVSEEDVEKEYQNIATSNNVPLERVKERIAEKSLRRDLLRLRASEFVKENAQIEEVVPDIEVVVPSENADSEEGAKEKPAKKPAAKKPATKKKVAPDAAEEAADKEPESVTPESEA